MLSRICDFCSSIIPNREKTVFTKNGKKFRFALLEVHIQNGVRWKEADICPKCMSKFLKQQLKKS